MTQKQISLVERIIFPPKDRKDIDELLAENSEVCDRAVKSLDINGKKFCQDLRKLLTPQDK